MPPPAHRRIAVLGLGYAGLPVALAFGRRFAGTVAFDVDSERVRRLASGEDPAREFSAQELGSVPLEFTADPVALAAADIFLVCVPTPIDEREEPDLSALREASQTVGRALRKGSVVVYQSTVYPGVTEEVCTPLLERASGLCAGADFGIGYAPERINPGDPEHAFERVRKVVSAGDPATLALLVELYQAVIPAGVVPVSSIRVAETAKLLENVQRDLNIALMNELALFCDRLGLDTRAVIDAAATKWNFHRYHPGLVGGHCVGVDPYYMTAKARELGLAPEVVLAGRRINNRMGRFVGERTLELLRALGIAVPGARVAVLGAAFKPDVADPRNSRVPELVQVLVERGIEALVHDPRVEPRALLAETGLVHVERGALANLQGVVLACPHRGLPELALELVGEDRVRLLVDVLGAVAPSRVPPGVRLWRL
jgi:UDP-N-acetyl-D-galactosamine dehydrogenase